MQRKSMRSPVAAIVTIAGAAFLPATVLATGVAGDHVQAFEQHIDEYEAGVGKLAAELDDVVARYKAGGDTDAAIAEFIQTWEAVKYHGAVETVATPMYSPIWQGINGLRTAINEDAGLEAVRKRKAELLAALHQGLGALKYKARAGESDGKAEGGGHHDHAGEHHGDDGVHGTMERIRGHLDRTVSAYADGNSDKATGLIQAAYFQNFEGLEGGLIEADPDLVTRLEEAFNAELPGLIQKGAPVDEVRAKVAAMKERLERAEKLLEARDDEKGKVF